MKQGNSGGDGGFILIDVLVLSLLLLSLLGMVRYSFFLLEESRNMEQRYMDQLVLTEAMDRMVMEHDTD